MARLFDGTAGYTVGSLMSVKPTGYTVAAFARASSTDGAFRDIVSLAAGGSEWQVLLRRDTAALAAYHRKSDASFASVSLASGVSLDTWLHAACTWDGATLRLYKNGVEVGTPASVTTARAAFSSLNGIGWKADSTSEQWKGDICDVGVWDIALGSAAISDLAKGVQPLGVRPDRLLLAAPLEGARTVDPVYGRMGVRSNVSVTPTGTPSPSASRLGHRVVPRKRKAVFV